jgi:hypothetical protein
MNKKNLRSLWAVIASLSFVTLACGLVINLTPEPVSTQAPFVLPTGIPPQVTASSTTPVPPAIENTSAAPLVVTEAPVVTPADSQIMTDVQDYFEKGYLPYENGDLTSLPDFSITQPSMDIHSFTRTKSQVQDFALWADIELNTIGSTTYPNYTGCGFAYRVQNNDRGYTAILTNDYIRMGACSSGMRQCELFGTRYGTTGEVQVGNKKTTQFSLVVNKDSAHVFVDGILAGQYGLFTTKLLGTGDLYYDAVSNYGAGYWTTCKITNVRLWESKP